ncbi:hypothetical protein U1Q18_018165, partial [Sarracenia purpurea var. burkii]
AHSLAESLKKSAKAFRKMAQERNAIVIALNARDLRVALLQETLEKERTDFEVKVAESIEQHMSIAEVRIQIGEHCDHGFDAFRDLAQRRWPDLDFDEIELEENAAPPAPQTVGEERVPYVEVPSSEVLGQEVPSLDISSSGTLDQDDGQTPLGRGLRSLT